ncbi:MAG TPA: ABC transporter ATP-binding protein [Devosiaceae bacterium]
MTLPRTGAQGALPQNETTSVDTFIDVRALRKRFGSVDVVNDLNFSVRRGEILGLLGPNGAGKSTTLKMITGYLAPTAGTVAICGRDMAADPLEAKRHLGYLPEGAPLYNEMTPEALLRFAGAVRHMPSALRRRRSAEVIDALELGRVLYQRIETLSKGFKRRVGLAQAILHNPDVLILDEPTDGLDPNQKRQVRELIHMLARDKAIIISTHLLEEVDAFCSRALIIDRGRIVLEGSPADLHAMAGDHNEVTIYLPGQDIGRAEAAIGRIGAVTLRRGAARDETRETLLARPADGRPITEAIAATLHEAGLTNFELSTEPGRLDDVFRRFTSSDSTPSATETAA